MSSADAARVQQELLQSAQRKIQGSGVAIDTSNFDGFASSSAYRGIITELPSPSKAAKKAHTAARNTFTMPMPVARPSPHHGGGASAASAAPAVSLKSPLAAANSSPTGAAASPSAFTFASVSSPAGKSPSKQHAAAWSPMSAGGGEHALSSPTARRHAPDAQTAALINRPHRVDPPPEMHAPVRRESASAASAAAAAASSSSASTIKSPVAAAAAKVALEVANSALVAQNERQRIGELALLATACHRGGRVRGEAFNYFSMGVLHDNLREPLKAIACYQKFARLCELSNDRAGQLLADNVIGVSYQNAGAEYYGDALVHHERHVESPNLHDKFIAHTNMGLIYAACQRSSDAALHHQHALRYAIRLGSVPAQSVAIGNLGLTGSAQKDLVTAKACMERYLELSSAMHDSRALSNAHATLGQIASDEGEFRAGVQHFHLALRTAQSHGDRALAATSKVNLGVALGNTMMEEHMKKMALVLTKAHDDGGGASGTGGAGGGDSGGIHGADASPDADEDY